MEMKELGFVYLFLEEVVENSMDQGKLSQWTTKAQQERYFSTNNKNLNCFKKETIYKTNKK